MFFCLDIYYLFVDLLIELSMNLLDSSQSGALFSYFQVIFDILDGILHKRTFIEVFESFSSEIRLNNQK